MLLSRVSHLVFPLVIDKCFGDTESCVGMLFLLTLHILGIHWCILPSTVIYMMYANYAICISFIVYTFINWNSVKNSSSFIYSCQ